MTDRPHAIRQLESDHATSTTAPAVLASSPGSLRLASASEQDSASPWGIVGACLGGLLVVLLVYFVWRRSRRKHHEKAGCADDYGSVLTPDGGHEDQWACGDETPNGSDDPRDGSVSEWITPTIVSARITRDDVQLLTKHSSNAFGELYIGQYQQQTVLVKVLPSDRQDRVNVKCLYEEVGLVATLQHDHILACIGVAWTTPEDPWMVSAFANGGDVREQLQVYKERGLPCGFNAEKLKIASQTASTLTYLHGREPPILHRDLKSSALLLTDSGDVQLTGFDIARPYEDVTLTAGVGSGLWMAPEVLLGEYYDEKADVYSFGVVLSELDTHELPYATTEGRKVLDIVIIQRVAKGELSPQFTHAVSPQLLALARACLERDAEMRPSAADVMYRLDQMRQEAE